MSPQNDQHWTWSGVRAGDGLQLAGVEAWPCAFATETGGRAANDYTPIDGAAAFSGPASITTKPELLHAEACVRESGLNDS